jgi:hypothetical protein
LGARSAVWTAHPFLPARLGTKARFLVHEPEAAAMDSFQKRERNRRQMQKRREKDERRKLRIASKPFHAGEPHEPNPADPAAPAAEASPKPAPSNGPPA